MLARVGVGQDLIGGDWDYLSLDEMQRTYTQRVPELEFPQLSAACDLEPGPQGLLPLERPQAQPSNLTKITSL